MYDTKPAQRTLLARSKDYALSGLMKELVWLLMDQEGRDRTICEYCHKPIKGNPELHHTKYEGATYYDLMIVCSSCNRLAVNCNLA